jgi:hypothetical protein
MIGHPGLVFRDEKNEDVVADDIIELRINSHGNRLT